MGRKSRSKNNKTHRKIEPEVLYGDGPIKIAKYGNSILVKNDMTEEEREQFLLDKAEFAKESLKELKQKIAELQTLIAEYDPVILMHRAAYELFILFIKHKSEADFSPEENLRLPGVEYLQYLISRTNITGGKTELTEEAWNVIWQLAKDSIVLVRKWIMNRPTLNNPPDATDELRFFIDNKRLSVRVERYAVFMEDYWSDALTPYAAWISDTYGITVDELIAGLRNLHNYQKTGLIDRYYKAMSSTNALMQLLMNRGFKIDPSAPPEEMDKVREALATEDFAKEYSAMQENMSKAFTPAIFDITDIAQLPSAVLDVLSVQAGESIQTDFESNDDISPLSNSVLHYKPFLKANGRYYHFFHTGFEDRIAEIIEQDLISKIPGAVDSMMNNRGHKLETGMLDLMAKILQPDQIHLNAFYPNPDIPGTLTELDGLITVDDVLFLVEGKAGKFSEAASRGAPKSLLADLTNLIVEGQRQSERAERYINSAGKVTFFDSSGTRIVCTLERKNYRRIFRVVVTREPLGWVGAKIARLSILDETLLKSPPWHVAIDDLRSIAVLFDKKGPQFCHYLEQRLTAAEDASITTFCEMEHVGLYLQHNFYHIPEIEFKGGMQANRMFSEYARNIDYYFADKYVGAESEVPGQNLPEHFKALIEALSVSKCSGRFETVDFLLAFDDRGRAYLDKHLKMLTERFLQGRRISVRLSQPESKKGISITFAENRQLEVERARSAALAISSDSESWLIVQIKNVSPYKIEYVEQLSPETVPKEDLEVAMDYLNTKAADEIGKTKVGRNDPCPCASGKKYKYCHGKT